MRTPEARDGMPVKRIMQHQRWIAVACAMLSYTALARAQPAADTAGAARAAPSLVPPKLAHGVTPAYPEAERARGAAATVLLELTLDASGKVTDAVVARSGGAAFDAAALTAAGALE